MKNVYFKSHYCDVTKKKKMKNVLTLTLFFFCITLLPNAPRTTAAMHSSWEMSIKTVLWNQRVAYPKHIQSNFSLAVPILAQTLTKAYAACHGNRHVFALTLQRMCVVEKTKAFFMVRSSSLHTIT